MAGRKRPAARTAPNPAQFATPPARPRSRLRHWRPGSPRKLPGEQGPEAGAAGTGPTHPELAECGSRRAPRPDERGAAPGARPSARPLARHGELGAHSGRRRSFATLAAILPQPLSLPLRPGGRAEAAPTRAPPPSGGLGRRLPPRAERRAYLGLASWVVGAAPVPFRLSLTLTPAPAALPRARPAASAIAHSAWSATASCRSRAPGAFPLGRGKGPGAQREANLATPARRRSGCSLPAGERSPSPRGQGCTLISHQVFTGMAG